MKKLTCIICIFAYALTASALDVITATIALTNQPADGATITVNGNTRTWKGTVTTPTSQIATNATIAGSATNMFLQFAGNPFTSLSVGRTTSTNVTLLTQPGVALTITISTNWALVTYSTNTATSARLVRVPMSVEQSGPRAEMASQLVSDLNNYSTNAFFESATSVANLVGKTNAQTITGTKYFAGVLTASNQLSVLWVGTFQSTNLSGFLNALTNGLLWNVGATNLHMTNSANYGNAFRSPGRGVASEQIGTGAIAAGDGSLAIGNSAFATNDNTTALGSGATAIFADAVAFGSGTLAGAPAAMAIGTVSTANGTNSIAIGAGSDAEYTESIAFGYSAVTTGTNQIRLGRASSWVSIPGALQAEGNTIASQNYSTNNFNANSDIAFRRFYIGSLANGNNAAVPVGTNVFCEVAGPSGAFTINGINAAGGAMRDGKWLRLLNLTGQNMTIAHESGTDPAAANRIWTMTGSDVATTGNGIADFFYHSQSNRWICVFVTP